MTLRELIITAIVILMQMVSTVVTQKGMFGNLSKTSQVRIRTATNVISNAGIEPAWN